MEYLNIYNNNNCLIFTSRRTANKNGKLLTVENTPPRTSSSQQSSSVRFTTATFDQSGNRLLCADHHGVVYLLDFLQNRSRRVIRAPSGCSSLQFTVNKENEILAGLLDYTLRCYDIESGEQLAVMRGHDASISAISVHAGGNFALSTASDSVFLWDLRTFQRKRKLNVKEDVGILQVFFLPNSNSIVSCFRDDSIFVWDSESLACKFQLASPDYPNPAYRTFAISTDGRYLAAGGRSRLLHLWNLESRQLQQVLDLPSSVTSVRQIHFLAPIKLGDSSSAGQETIISVLGQDRRLRLIRLSDCKLLVEMMEGALVQSCVVSAHGDLMALINVDGFIQLHSLKSINKELNKPPPPMVSVWADKSQGIKKKSIERPFSTPAAKSSDISMDKSGVLGKKKLRAILKEYGQFPAKYRPFIWRSVLEFPENFITFASLVDKGVHPAFEMLHEKYPVKSQKLFRVLQRTLSALAHWSPIFGETDYLPLLAFPFIKVFQNNQVYAFEMVATILCNWSAHWFEYFPNPPINILSMVENVLSHHDRELYDHFVVCGVTTEMYAWPLLETVMSEVLTNEEWLCLWDTIICHHPGFLLICVVAYSICARSPLLRVHEIHDFEYFFHHRNAVTVQEVLRQAHLLTSRTPKDLHPSHLLPALVPLTRPQYPVVHRYPKFIVDYQIRERERIRAEEKDYLKQRETSLNLQKKTERHTAEEENWYRQQELLINAEEKRRRLIAEEEERLRQQRKRLSALNRELKTKELQLFDGARSKFRDFHNKQRQVELKRLEDELIRKSRQRSEETSIAIDVAESRGLELAMQRRMFETELCRQDTGGADKQGVEGQRLSCLLADIDRERDDIQGATADRNYDRLKEPMKELAQIDRARIDDNYYSQVAERLDKFRTATFEGLELEDITGKNDQLEEEIEGLLGRLREARKDITDRYSDAVEPALERVVSDSDLSENWK